MQTLTDQLTTAVAPHFSPDDAAPTRTLKGVAKTLRRLAKQLTAQQAKQAREAEKATMPTAKELRKALAGELLSALKPHLGLAKAKSAEAPKPIIKTVSRLAEQILKQRRKQTKQAAKALRQAAKKEKKQAKQAHPVAPVLKVVRLAPAANGQPVVAARRVRTKRSASTATVASKQKEPVPASAA